VGKPVGADKRRRSKTPRETFGRAVTEMRVQKGISQVSMAEDLGYGSNYLGLIERGTANATCDVMAAISSYFRMSIAQFWTYAEDLQARRIAKR
jgi:transcriptional regulator with XRE-family HTH domain